MKFGGDQAAGDKDEIQRLTGNCELRSIVLCSHGIKVISVSCVVPLDVFVKICLTVLLTIICLRTFLSVLSILQLIEIHTFN